jgi:sarcosine oxidase
VNASAVVVGAGAFGTWTAWHLAQAGFRVTLVDGYGPANGRASSADHSRISRASYGADTIYSRWAAESLQEWLWLQEQVGVPLVTRTGALFLGPPDDTYVRASFDALSALALSVEWIDAAALATRFPQISSAGLGSAILETDAAVIRARLAVRALATLAAARAGVTCRLAQLQPLDESRASPALQLLDGERLTADVYVLACGPWLPRLLPDAVGGRIRPTRQEVLYFGVPPGDDRFSHPRLPVWVDFAAGFYGVPDLDGQGFKLGVDRHGPSIDPDVADRLVAPALVAEVRGWLAHRFPDLARAPLVDSRVCQYENTSSGDFVLDRHPSWPNLWIVGGGSGHGFKHGPAVGRYVARLVAGTNTSDTRFSLANKSTVAARAIF